jgi:hypothetical protein
MVAQKPPNNEREVCEDFVEKMAGVTRLELAASGVTGRRSNQLSYTPIAYIRGLKLKALPAWVREI